MRVFRGSRILCPLQLRQGRGKCFNRGERS
jgi:hypothetical protein